MSKEYRTHKKSREIANEAAKEGVTASYNAVRNLRLAIQRGEDVSLYETIMTVDDCNSWVEFYVGKNQELCDRYGFKVEFDEQHNWQIVDKKKDE